MANFPQLFHSLVADYTLQSPATITRSSVFLTLLDQHLSRLVIQRIRRSWRFAAGQLDCRRRNGKKFLLILAIALCSASSAYAEGPALEYIPLGWVLFKYVNCTGGPHPKICFIADPTGTPLNIRTLPRGTQASSILNGVPVTILDIKDGWAFIAVITGDVSGRYNVRCEIFTTDMGSIGCQSRTTN
jgi:hypothetical protein